VDLKKSQRANNSNYHPRLQPPGTEETEVGNILDLRLRCVTLAAGHGQLATATTYARRRIYVGDNSVGVEPDEETRHCAPEARQSLLYAVGERR